MSGIDGCLTRAMTINGVRGVALIDGTSGLLVAAVGDSGAGGWEEDAARMADVVRALFATPAIRRIGPDEATTSGSGGHHLLTRIPSARNDGLFLHLVLDADKGNLALARHGLRAVVAAISDLVPSRSLSAHPGPGHRGTEDAELLQRVREGLRELP